MARQKPDPRLTQHLAPVPGQRKRGPDRDEVKIREEGGRQQIDPRRDATQVGRELGHV